MNLGFAVLLILLIGIIASAAKVDIANNTTILLILLFALVAYSKAKNCCGSNGNNGCGCRGTFSTL